MGIYDDYSMDMERQINDANTEFNKLISNFVDDLGLKKRSIVINGVKLAYRGQQIKFMKLVMAAIRDNQVLVIQAGTGVGKSMAYLIPIFCYFNNVEKFNRVVISTSSIALQQQLLTDINAVSNLLEVPIKAVIAKGVNNYACLSQISKALSSVYVSEDDKETISQILAEMRNGNTADRDELSRISDEVWEQIKLRSSFYCRKCPYRRECAYTKLSEQVDNANIVITNHNYLARSVLDDKDFTANVDMFVFDEAHRLEGAVRDVSAGSIGLERIKYVLDSLCLPNNPKWNQCITETKVKISDLFYHVRKRAFGYFRENNEEIGMRVVDCDKIYFSIDKMEDEVACIVSKLEYIVSKIRDGKFWNKNTINYVELVLKIFKDMMLKDNSENIYWANFIADKSIKLGYTCRNTTRVTNSILRKDVPVVLTSATLTGSNGEYTYFEIRLGLKAINRTKVDGLVLESPYNYSKNSVFYYDTEIANPKENHSLYLKQLVEKIANIIRTTNGRSLILFTSKKDMKYVYEQLSNMNFGFKVMMQGQSSNQQLCSEFESNVKSCLLATGAFWEGIDINGKGLSNVIIARLVQ